MTKRFKTALLFLAVCFALGCLLLRILYWDMCMKDHARLMNSVAKMHYNYCRKGGFIDLTSILDLPSFGEYFILGECYNVEYYVAYANDFVEQDILLIGNSQTEANGYWAVKVNNGDVVAAWSSHHPLREDQLVKYTFNEQCKQIYFFEELNKSNVIGYYSIEENIDD